MSAYQVGDKFIIEIVDIIHRKSERYGDETVSYVVDQMDAFEFEDVDLDRLELYEQAETPQMEVPRQMRTFSEGGIDYAPQTDFIEDDKCFDCEDFFTCDEHQTDCGRK